MGVVSKILPFALAALSANAAEILSAPAGAETIADKYIVVMKDSVSSKDFDAHTEWVTNTHRRALGRRGAAAHDGMKKTYTFGTGMKGYSGAFDKATIKEIAKREDVCQSQTPSSI